MAAQEPFDILLLARGIHQSRIKAANERTVLAQIATNPRISGAEIARRSGLGAQTVSRILVDLERRGLVRRGEVLRGRRGQPATPFHLVSECAYAIGCEVSWRHLTMIVRDMGGVTLGHRRIEYPYPEPDRVAGAIVEGVAELRDLVPAACRDRILAIGLAAPGPIDRVVGQFGAAPEVGAAWRNFDLRAEVARRTGIRTFIFNDGNAACWSELLAQKPRPTSFIYFFVATNLASGIVSEGRLWNGYSRQGANLGAMIVDDGHGGHVLVNSVASLTTLGHVLANWGVAAPASEGERWATEALEPALTLWLEQASRALAHAIANAVVVADLSLAVVDGLPPRDVLERLVVGIRKHLDAMPPRSTPAPRVETGNRGEMAPALGAAQLALYREFFDADWMSLGL